MKRAVEHAKAITVGDPFVKGENGTTASMGPLISQTQLNTVLRYIESGISEGAKLLLGGKRHG